MTEELYLPDSDDVLEFTTKIKEATNDYLILDSTYFHVKGGGQPGDEGVMSWNNGMAKINDVTRDHGNILHHVDYIKGELPDEGTEVEAEINKEKRKILERLHTAQHLLSRVILDEHGARTIDNQIETDESWIDIRSIGLEKNELEIIETEANNLIKKCLPIKKTNQSRDSVKDQVSGGRKQLIKNIPDHMDILRVVEIGDIDICPCGGTHVDNLGEIKKVYIEDWKKSSRDKVRIYFDVTSH